MTHRSDILDRLEDAARLLGNPIPPDIVAVPGLLREAADAIRALREELDQYRNAPIGSAPLAIAVGQPALTRVGISELWRARERAERAEAERDSLLEEVGQLMQALAEKAAQE